MAKSFPVIDIKCDECGKEMSIGLEYDNERERWLNATHVYVRDNHSGWQIRFGGGVRDYCKECNHKFDHTD